jgi:hypothetical protein
MSVSRVLQQKKLANFVVHITNVKWQAGKFRVGNSITRQHPAMMIFPATSWTDTSNSGDREKKPASFHQANFSNRSLSREVHGTVHWNEDRVTMHFAPNQLKPNSINHKLGKLSNYQERATRLTHVDSTNALTRNYVLRRKKPSHSGRTEKLQETSPYCSPQFKSNVNHPRSSEAEIGRHFLFIAFVLAKDLSNKTF